MGAKKTDGTALAAQTQKNAIKRKFDKRFVIPLDAYGLKEDLIVRLEL